MKKIKRLMPIICSIGTISTTAPLLASCTFFHNPEKTACSFTGGDTYLLGGVEEGKPIETTAAKPWVFVFDGLPVRPSHVELIFLDKSNPSDIHVDVNDKGECYVRWGKMATLGTHQFVILATYASKKDKNIYQRTSDLITLEITSSEKLVLPQGKDANYKIIPEIWGDNYGNIHDIWEIRLPNCAIINTDRLQYDYIVRASLKTETEEIGTFLEGFLEGKNGNRADIVLHFHTKSTTPVITQRGKFDFTFSITNENTGATLVQTTPIQAEANFETDSWTNVITYAKKGLKALQNHYGIQNFVGLQRSIHVNGIGHTVRVIGQEQDVNEKGKKMPLTFEFTTAISHGKSSDLYLGGSPLLIKLKSYSPSLHYGYLESSIDNALNDDEFNDWYAHPRFSDVQKTDLHFGVLRMIEPEVAAAIEPIQRQYFTTDFNSNVTWETKYCKLCTPCLHNYLSIYKIFKDYADTPTYIRELMVQEGFQYQYYAQTLNPYDDDRSDWTYSADQSEAITALAKKDATSDALTLDRAALSSFYMQQDRGLRGLFDVRQSYEPYIRLVDTVADSFTPSYAALAPIFAI